MAICLFLETNFVHFWATCLYDTFNCVFSHLSPAPTDSWDDQTFVGCVWAAHPCRAGDPVQGPPLRPNQGLHTEESKGQTLESRIVWRPLPISRWTIVHGDLDQLLLLFLIPRECSMQRISVEQLKVRKLINSLFTVFIIIAQLSIDLFCCACTVTLIFVFSSLCLHCAEVSEYNVRVLIVPKKLCYNQ